jgi:hypothetical protein
MGRPPDSNLVHTSGSNTMVTSRKGWVREKLSRAGWGKITEESISGREFRNT